MKKFFSPFNGLNKNQNRWIETLKRNAIISTHNPLIKNIITVFYTILVHKRIQFNVVYFHCQTSRTSGLICLPTFPIIPSL